MKIGILVTGFVPDELRTTYHSYAAMFMQLLASTNGDFDYQIFTLCDNEFPANLELCDGWIITGSKSNVDEKLEWIPKLKQLILDIDASGKPLIGVCFGHQIIAEAFGGRAESYKGGWGVGIQKYQLCSDNIFQTTQSDIKLCAMHRYQVSIKPERAICFARSDFCAYAGLYYGKHIISLQPHPEFIPEYEKDLLLLRDKAGIIPKELVQTGLVSIKEEKTDSAKVGQWFADFLLARV